MTHYLFHSQRLSFRNWTKNDIDIMYKEINNDDDDVMEFFPFKPSRKDTEGFITRMQQQFSKLGHCYFAVDIKDTKEFIGFIGLSEQNYLEDPSSFVDIGWRLKKSSWNKGYATEGAKRCLAYGFNHLKLETIYSVASIINHKSESVMKKIGMYKVKNFRHPKFTDSPNLASCVLYQVNKS